MTPGITLRALRYEDWSRVHEWASTPEACRYQPWGPNTPDETRAYIRAEADAWSSAPQTRYAWAAVAGDAGVVGLGGLRLKSANDGMIDYAVHIQHWGAGIGTEIARLVTDYGFTELDLHRIAATCDPRNVGSAHILGNIGMTYEGRMREVKRVRDGWRDSSLYSILENEWRAADTSEGC